LASYSRSCERKVIGDEEISSVDEGISLVFVYAMNKGIWMPRV